MKRSIVIFISIIVAFSFASLFGEYRDFKNKSGKSIRAKVIGVDGAKVKITRDDGKEFTFLTSTLLKEDQEYVRKWAQSNLLSLERSLKISVKRQTGNVSRTERSMIAYKHYDVFYEIKIENKTLTDFMDFEVRYQFYSMSARSKYGDADGLRFIRGVNKVDLLSAQSSIVFTTDKIALRESRSTSSSYYRGGNDKLKNKLGGLWLKVFMDGKEMRDVSTPAKLRNGRTWIFDDEK